MIWKRLDRRVHFCLSAGITLYKISNMNFTAKSNYIQLEIRELRDFYEGELIKITKQLAYDDFAKLKRFMIKNVYADVFKHNIIKAAEMARFEKFFAQRAVLGKFYMTEVKYDCSGPEVKKWHLWNNPFYMHNILIISFDSIFSFQFSKKIVYFFVAILRWLGSLFYFWILFTINVLAFLPSFRFCTKIFLVFVWRNF